MTNRIHDSALVGRIAATLAAVTFFMAAPARSAADEKPPPDRWEYLFVNGGFGPASDPNAEWRARYINGVEIENWFKGPTIYEYANIMGEQGWELISVPITSSQNANQGNMATRQAIMYRLVFKRPKRSAVAPPPSPALPPAK